LHLTLIVARKFEQCLCERWFAFLTRQIAAGGCLIG
jgi:hypothetical protein